MSEFKTLADQAVETLAAIRAMDEGLTLEHPERHVIRGMKRSVEQMVSSALTAALELTWQAKALRELPLLGSNDK